MADATTSPTARRFAGQRIAFAGRLGGVTKREAFALVRQQGGLPVELSESPVDLLVIGAEHLPLDVSELLDERARRAVDEGQTQVLTETEFWAALGLLDSDQSIHPWHTPAMLAELLQVPLATIRRWHRRGLIVPVREVHRLPYFDFREVAAARQLAGLLAAGMSVTAIERKLAQLARFVPNVDRSLRQLAVIVEGRQILLRQGEGLVEPNGQLRFDFEACESQPVAIGSGRDDLATGVLTTADGGFPSDASGDRDDRGDSESWGDPGSPEALLQAAVAYEERGQLAEAAESYRAALAAGGPRADICFQLAELLYRMGDINGARERYYMAIELDENLVESRASLGCVLAESGELELAIAAFQGALTYHPYYADVHYHLARTLGELGRNDEACEHWRNFLQLAPDSPWAEEARLWLRLTAAEAAMT